MCTDGPSFRESMSALVLLSPHLTLILGVDNWWDGLMSWMLAWKATGFLLPSYVHL